MKIVRFLFISFAITLLINACKYSDSKHYVDKYITSFDAIAISEIEHLKDTNIIYVGIDWKKPNVYIDKRHNFALYERISMENNDVSYDKVLVSILREHSRRLYRYFIIERIADVDVKSDVAWDASHPVGSSLKDLFIFFSGSPDSYINSGYRSVDEYALGEFFRRFPNLSKYGQNLYSGSNGTMVPFADKLSEIEFYKYNLINAWHGNLFLLFPAVPIPAPETKVTVSMTLSNGKTYTASKILKQQ